MNFEQVRRQMAELSTTKNWRNLVDLIDDGYKGIFVMMRIVRDSTHAVTAGDLAKQMNVSTARVASGLNTLQRKGYVRRERLANDGRKVVVQLTGDGEKALCTREERIEKMVLPIMDKLTPQEFEQFFHLLGKLLK